jgi:hypothetical protein
MEDKLLGSKKPVVKFDVQSTLSTGFLSSSGSTQPPPLVAANIIKLCLCIPNSLAFRFSEEPTVVSQSSQSFSFHDPFSLSSSSSLSSILSSLPSSSPSFFLSFELILQTLAKNNEFHTDIIEVFI